MALRLGSVTVDLECGAVYGDSDHCPKEELLESAQALISLLPRVNEPRVWGIAKDADDGCYLLIDVEEMACSYKVGEIEFKGRLCEPEAEINLEADFGNYWRKPSPILRLLAAEHDIYFYQNDYEPLIGSVKDGTISDDINGVATNHYLKGLHGEAKKEEEKEAKRREAQRERQTQLILEL
jgi:hypothetical protein